jgi:ubiquinone/menaquinone biosynthesis C-methylase UbiE
VARAVTERPVTASPRDPGGGAVQSYFDRVAAHWSAHYMPGGLMESRIARFLAAAEPVARPDLRVLDFGCGSGELARAMAGQGWRVNACDISREMLRAAEAAPGGDGVEWRAVQSGGALPFADGSFDLVTASSVFEYIAAPEAGLAELCRVLAPGGLLLITVPDMRHPVRLAEEKSRHSLGGRVKRGLRRIARGGAETDYLKYSIQRPTPEEWCALLRIAGFAPQPFPACDEPLLLLAALKKEKGC